MQNTPVTAQNLWGIKPKDVRPAQAQPFTPPTNAGGLLPVAEMQTMRMKAALKASQVPLSCSGGACFTR